LADYLDTPNPLTIQVAPPERGPEPVKAIFKASPEKPTVSEPGKQPGDVVVVTSENKYSVIVSLSFQSKRTAETFRQAGGGLARWLRQTNTTAIDIDLNEFNDYSIPDALSALCEGLFLGSFQFNRRKSKTDPVVNAQVVLRGGKDISEIAERVRHAQVLTSAVNMARDWSHEPPNIINPITLAERVETVAASHGLRCTVLDDNTLAEMKAGAILSVGKGSLTPSRMIILEYPGHNPHKDAKPVVLIGKALTFDTGGYSIKSSDNIQGMKYDKSGGLAVIAALRAAADLQLTNPVIGIVGAAENKISGGSYLPDDIITTLSGITVEIISTDAEGRMVLADLLTYAQTHFAPKAMIDLATLTGGVVVALGHVRAGMMTNNNDLSQALMQAGERTYERLWQLPLDEEYGKLIKSKDADIKNGGGREAHSIMGGMFLKEFVSNEEPWAHLDIAGMADTQKELPYCPEGGTGFGVRLLIDYLEHQ